MLRSEGNLDAEPAIRFPSRKDQYTKTGPQLCKMPDCYATSAWPMLRYEGVWTLSQRLDSPGRKDQHTKTGTLTLQDARLLCDKRMAYATV